MLHADSIDCGGVAGPGLGVQADRRPGSCEGPSAAMLIEVGAPGAHLGALARSNSRYVPQNQALGLGLQVLTELCLRSAPGGVGAGIKHYDYSSVGALGFWRWSCEMQLVSEGLKPLFAELAPTEMRAVTSVL
jgi:hypothetical protein